MATTISNDGPKVQELPPFAEHDKLGPLGGRQAVLANESELRQVLVAEFAATAAAAQVEALEAALPPTIAWSDVERGVRAVYDEARSARKAARRSKRAFHTWRRRSKELTYQLELLAGYAGPHLAELYREIQGATD